MNKEETKKAIEVMQAYVDGEQIQVKLPTGWINEFNPSWYLHSQYRVKPEAKTIWVNEYGADLCAHTTREAAVFNCTQITAKREAVKYREVIE